MLLGKIGNKSIAFINHKPFHPGNLQNLEKVWLAEQKAETDRKNQAELLERRKHEIQIEELRKALRKKEREQSQALIQTVKENVTKQGLVPEELSHKSKRQKKKKHSKAPAVFTGVISKFTEDVYLRKHTSVWGSYFDRTSQRWGYACCHSLDLHTTCAAQAS